MRKSINLLEQEFISSSGKTPQWTAFARTFKREIKKDLADANCELTGWINGHFYCSGFFRDEQDKCYYFSISDVRWPMFDHGKMLIRTAKDEKDYTGGHNEYFQIETGMFKRYLFVNSHIIVATIK